MMWASAIYICPVRGLADLEPPHPVYLGRTAGIARSLGLDRLMIPVLEESLLRANRHKVRFLDGLIQGLDQVEDAGIKVWLLAPAQRILGVEWVAPYLVRGSLDSRSTPVFVDGAMRPLRPFTWWADPSIVRKRLECFRELVAAIGGHPALAGWVIMDRIVEWSKPESQSADLILKSYCAEIRAHDEAGEICLSLDMSGLLYPQLIRMLARQVDALYLRGMDADFKEWKRRDDLTEEVSLASYLCSMAHWLFGKQVSPEIGWAMMSDMDVREETLASVSVFGRQGGAGLTWLNLIDPEKHLHSRPPWNVQPGYEKTGLLDWGGEPKKGVEALIKEIRSNPHQSSAIDFIDIDQQEYLTDPATHLRRLWDHFREATG
ncbi:MAG: hypothetical protein K9N21_17245 [Deltaproteobacteria bacterium]|nr:hypothetical protein [Deltaproteobacteria bacterium]